MQIKFLIQTLEFYFDLKSYKAWLSHTIIHLLLLPKVDFSPQMHLAYLQHSDCLQLAICDKLSILAGP